MPNTIKLDREFLSNSSNSTKGKKIIRNVIALCLDLKMDVVTEGIETKDQIDFFYPLRLPDRPRLLLRQTSVRKRFHNFCRRISYQYTGQFCLSSGWRSPKRGRLPGGTFLRGSTGYLWSRYLQRFQISVFPRRCHGGRHTGTSTGLYCQRQFCYFPLAVSGRTLSMDRCYVC